MTPQQQAAYQPLFNLLANEHGLTLTISEMDEIINAVEQVQENMKARCDVEGCENEPSSGGCAWRETGYWCLCIQHDIDYREGKPQPEMKAGAVER